MLVDQLVKAFPDLALIKDTRLRDLVRTMWREIEKRGDPVHKDIERIPMHPSFDFEKSGGLTNHCRAQMAVAKVLVPTYAKEWKIELSLDHFLACAAVHDSAKVIEFVQKDGELVATPGFDHALVAGRLARDLDFPAEICHMIAVHTYVGPMRLARTGPAQLFQFIDPLCLPVWPEHGKSSVVRHLEANRFTPPPPPDDVP